VDLMLHIYAHIDMGANAATNYDPEYVKRIRQVKVSEGSMYKDAVLDLEEELREISEWGRTDIKAVYLAAVSLFVDSPEDLVTALQTMAGRVKHSGNLDPGEAAQVSSLSRRLALSADEKQMVAHLSDIVEREYAKFYATYHTLNELEYDSRGDAFRTLMSSVGVEAIAPFLKRGGMTHLTVWLSEARRVAAWGVATGSTTGAVVPLPEVGEDGYRTYFWLVHELTHGLTDPLVVQATGFDSSARSPIEGSEGYEVHQALEAGAILADYWIFKSYDERLCSRYLEWCREHTGYEPLSIPLEDSLKETIRKTFSQR